VVRVVEASDVTPAKIQGHHALQSQQSIVILASCPQDIGAGATLPDQMDIPSLCSILSRPGDIVYIPMGYLIVEKIINADAIGLRTRFCCLWWVVLC
jgi:hypothetical protein